MKTKFFILTFLISLVCSIQSQITNKQVDSIIDAAYNNQENFNSVRIADKAYQLAEKIGYKHGQMEAILAKCDYYINVRDDKKALEIAQQLYEFAKKENWQYYQIYALKNQAYSYSYLGFFDKAYESIDRAEDISKQLTGDDFYEQLGDIYQCRSEIENIKGNLQSKVLEYNRKSVQYYEKLKNYKRRYQAVSIQYYNLGFSYNNIGEYDSAIYYYRKAYHVSKKIKAKRNTGMGAFGIANSYLKVQALDSALHYYKLAEPLLVGSEKQYIYEDMAFIYSNKKDLKNYEFYTEKARNLQSETLIKEKQNVNKVTGTLLSEEEKKGNRRLYFILSAVIIASIIVCIFIYRLLRNYTRTKKLKQQTETDLLEKEEIVNKLESKVNEAFAEVTELAKSNNPSFLSRFREVYPEFYSTLTTNYPSLTVGQIEFCAFLRLNFSTKEISSIQNLSIRTIQGKKNQLRKQLDIPSDVDLNIFMMEM